MMEGLQILEKSLDDDDCFPRSHFPLHFDVENLHQIRMKQ